MEPASKSRREVMQLLVALGVTAADARIALAQSKSGTDGNGGKVIFDNEKCRVVEHAGKPRMGVCGTGLHSHPPHLTVCLTDVRAKVTLPGKDAFVAENKAGDVFWDPGGAHIVENIGSRDSRAYLIEVKGT
jgi:hypothetical protein